MTRQPITIDKKLFVNTGLRLNIDNINVVESKDSFNSSFKKLCQNIQLLINQQIPININVDFSYMKNFVEYDENFLEFVNFNYKEPKCNMIACLPLMKPQASMEQYFSCMCQIVKLMIITCILNCD